MSKAKGFLACLTLVGLICLGREMTKPKYKSKAVIELENDMFGLGRKVFYELTFGNELREVEKYLEKKKK